MTWVIAVIGLVAQISIMIVHLVCFCGKLGIVAIVMVMHIAEKTMDIIGPLSLIHLLMLMPCVSMALIMFI